MFSDFCSTRGFSCTAVKFPRPDGLGAFFWLRPKWKLWTLSTRGGEVEKKANDYVSDETNRMISNLLPEGFLNKNAALVLPNAVYFEDESCAQRVSLVRVARTVHTELMSRAD